MKKINFILVSMLLCSICFAQTRDRSSMVKLIDDEFKFAADQYKVLSKNIPEGQTPQSYANGQSINKDIKWWCSGFYSGSLWYIYEQTKDEAIKKEAEEALKTIAPNQTYTGNHDLGFMMYCSFGECL